MTKFLSERVLIGLVVLGVVVGLVSLRHRLTAEAALQQVEILLDCQALVDWQASLKEAGADLPARLLEARIGSLAFSEMHLDDLVENGRATPLNFQEFDLALKGGGLISPSNPTYAAASLFNLKKWGSQKPGSYLLFAEPEMAQTVARTLAITIGSEVELILDGRVLYVPVAVRQLRPLSLGFDVASIRDWSAQGFRVWIRPENSPGLSVEQIQDLFGLWSALPSVQGVIFGGALNEAIGYPDNLETTTAELAKRDWKVGYIELPERAQQLGIETLVRELPAQTARVMAVSPAHQQKLSPFRVLGMYSLGARERNLRVLYVRPYAVPGNAELDDAFLFALPGEIAPLGPAATFTTPSLPPDPISVALMSLAAGALAILLLRLLGVSGPAWLVLALLVSPVLGGFAAQWVGRSILFRSLLALAVGMGGPTWAFLQWVYPSLASPNRSGRGDFVEGLRLLLIASVCSLATGLWVAALLSDTTFLLGLDRFRGVKLLTLVTPLLIVGAFLWKRYSVAQWMAGLMASVRVYQAALVGMMLAAFGLLLLRTGNDGGAVASDGERHLRVVLDQVLGVRPRFKEFLLAHPAFVCAPLVARRLGFLPSLLFVLLGAIGQAGIVDTFAHVHTPLQVTLIRVVLGVVLGTVFAGLFFLIVRRLLALVTKIFPIGVEREKEIV